MLALLTTGLITVTSFAALLLQRWFRQSSVENFPPGPPRKFLLGNLNLIYKNPHVHRTFHELGKQYNGIVGLRLGGHNVIVLTDYRLIREVCLAPDRPIDARPQLDYYDVLNKGYGFVMESGKSFEQLKSFCMRWLKCMKTPSDHHHTTFEQRVVEELQEFIPSLKQYHDVPFSIDRHLYPLVTNPICAIIFGRRFSHEDPQFKDLLYGIETISREAGPSNPFVFLPTWTFFLIPLLQSSAFEMKRILDNLRRFIREEIAEHKESYEPEKPRDFIDMFLDDIRKEGHSQILNDAQLESCIIQLIFASAENIQKTIGWTIFMLMKHPRVQNKCRKEILRQFRQNDTITYKDRLQLPYVEATMCEVMRIVSTAAITLPHVAIKNIQVGSYVIPENSVVYVNLYSVHHDSEAWPEVNEFKPERFLDTGNRSDTTSDNRDDSDVTTNDNRDDSDVTGAAAEEVNDGCSVVKNFDAFMPFMIGTRSCPGKTIAKEQLFITMATLLQHYEFKVDPAHPLLGDVGDARQGITLGAPEFKVRLVKVEVKE